MKKNKAEQPDTEETVEEKETALPEEENAADNYEQPAEDAPVQKSKEEEYLQLAQRIQADFDNYRKRNIALRADALADGKADAVKAFLPVIDNLERALETERQNGTEGSLMEGLELVLKQMTQVLKDLGVEEIDALGKPFDPECHNAVMQTPCGEGQKPGEIAAVFAKGYRLGNKVLRYAMVQVTN
ncbi:MAG: nucleotide exchange factor GrpE [Clostridia bacterium]|nr:nucleotide exchange factor GrpE [Clostridia bacterium]